MKRRFLCIIMVLALLISSMGVMNVNAATSGVYEYEMYTDKTVKITKYTGGAASELTIPEKIKGYPVVAIGEEAFMNAELYKINLPSSLERIEDFAFWNTAISVITIPKTVSHIGIGAFSGGLFEGYVTEYGSEHFRALNGVLYTADMKKLVSFPTVKSSSYDVGKNSVEIIGAYSFMYTMELNSVTLSDGVKTIEEGAFLNSSLQTINLGEGMETVGPYVFTGCTKLKSLHIPDSLKNLDYSALEQCLSLTTLTVGDNNPSYSVASGFLYDKAMTTVWVCPAGRNGTVVIPAGTQHIGEYAFAYCNKVTEIIVPDSVKSIGSYAFAECTSLKTINIPKSVERVGVLMFYECTNLADITIPEGFVLLYSYDFIDTAWYEAQPDGLLYLCRNLIGYKGNYENLTAVEVKEGTLAISDAAFFGYDKITSVKIPDSVKYIGNWAFEDCPLLTEVEIPSGVEEIGGYSLGYTYEYNEETEEGRDVPLDNFTIKGYADSAAESYAVANGFKFVDIGEPEVSKLLGDADLDEIITIKDATAIQKYLALLISFGSQQKINADMNGDGSVDIKDATAIQKYLAGIE